jgi:hypothetical protein
MFKSVTNSYCGLQAWLSNYVLLVKFLQKKNSWANIQKQYNFLNLSTDGNLYSHMACPKSIWPCARKTKFCISVVTIPNTLQSRPLVTPYT